MKQILFFALALCGLLATPIAAKEPQMNEQEAASLQLALDRGLDLYRYDQAAWHSTDAMLEDVPDPRAAGVSGWVVTNVADGLLVTYWRPDGDSFRGFYSAVWDGSKIKDRTVLEGDSTILSAEQIDFIRARQAVDTSGLARCTDKPFNTVILPPTRKGEPILVYMLTPQTDLASVPMGGHYRFSVKDGKVVDQRAFTKSCIGLAFQEEKADSGKPEALFITHLLDPVPTEIHVFSTLAIELPIYVATASNDHVWETGILNGTPQVMLVK